MTNQEEKTQKETRQMTKRSAEQAELLAKEQVRKKAYLVREQAIEEAQEARKLNGKKQPPATL